MNLKSAVQNLLTIVGMVGLVSFWFQRSSETAQIATASPQATLTITPAGLKERRIPHDPTSPFFGVHKLELRPIKRSEGYDWLPVDEGWIGCVPCFNALTFIAVIDAKSYAINGSTKGWARQMKVSFSDVSTMPVVDPISEGEVAAPNERGNPLASKFSDLIKDIQQVPGCSMTGGVHGSLGRTVDAVTSGVCFPGG